MARSKKISRLSDLTDLGHRADWSKLTDRLQKLDPGAVITETCPTWIAVKSFRSTILTIGNRVHTGDWRLSTRTYGRKIHCFLAPRSGKM